MVYVTRNFMTYGTIPTYIAIADSVKELEEMAEKSNLPKYGVIKTIIAIADVSNPFITCAGEKYQKMVHEGAIPLTGDVFSSHAIRIRQAVQAKLKKTRSSKKRQEILRAFSAY